MPIGYFIIIRRIKLILINPHSLLHLIYFQNIMHIMIKYAFMMKKVKIIMQILTLIHQFILTQLDPMIL